MKDKVNAIPLIGEIIKEELNKQGKTTVWLAEKLGCHRTNISSNPQLSSSASFLRLNVLSSLN